MLEKPRIAEVVYQAIDELNDTLETDLKLQKSAEQVLFGSDASLDSLGLVNLIVGVESILADDLEIEVSLTDEKAMSQTNSPFRTVATLVDYIHQRASE